MHRRSRSVLPLLLGVVCLVLLLNHIRYRTKNDDVQSPSKPKEELLPVYELPPALFAEEPAHLTPIDPSTLLPKGSYPIDVAHRNGYLHTGSVLYIMDSSGLLLFLQRSSDVVTCPGTWSILGEHSTVGEEIIQTVVRGVEEELGFVAVANGGRESYNPDSPGVWTVELHPKNEMKETLHVTIQKATDFPLYYIRNYGPRNDNRIDRQITYLWLVTFPKPHGEIHSMVFDDEVANHKWISLEKVRSWLSEDATKDNKVFRSDVGVLDDGPDEGDFCHRTIRSLYEVGLPTMV